VATSARAEHRAQVKARLEADGRWGAFWKWKGYVKITRGISDGRAWEEAEKDFQPMPPGQKWDGKTPCDTMGNIYDAASGRMMERTSGPRKVMPLKGAPGRAEDGEAEGEEGEGGSGTEAVVQTQFQDLPVPLAGAVSRVVFDGKPAAKLRDELDWVAANVCIIDVRPEDAPSATAWGMLAWARQNWTNWTEFYKSFMSRLMPTRSQVDREDDFSDDGRNVERTIESVLGSLHGADDAVQPPGSEGVEGEPEVPQGDQPSGV